MKTTNEIKLQLFFPLLLSVLLLFAQLYATPLKHCSVYVGPEIYQMYRIRDGGAKQDGRIDGVCIGFDRIKRYGWYLGIEYLYANGTLKGHSGSGMPLRSELTDQIIEARFGYNFQKDDARRPYFIPFGGYGYFHETNAFDATSPIPFKFTDTFNYVVAGFLSGVNFNPLISIGINFKVRFMLNGKSSITDDPFMEDTTLLMENEIQYRLDLPIKIVPSCALLGIEFYCGPFYEFRHFGGREGFPFDFMDTRFHLYGIQGAISYRF